MPSNPSSPKSRRRSSTQESGNSNPLNRQSQRVSQYSPISRRSSRLSNEGLSLGSDLVALNKNDNGLGSLADELADAWDDEEALDESTSEMYTAKLTDEVASLVSPVNFQDLESARDSGIDVGHPFGLRSQGKLSWKSQPRVEYELQEPDQNCNVGKSPHAQSEQTEEGSLGFVSAHISEVEKLSGYQSSSLGSTTHDDIIRVVEALKNLAGQADVESRTARLITVHTSVAMHIAQQSRALQMLTYSLLSPLTPPPVLDEINEILPMVIESTSMIPQPPTQALTSLTLFTETSRDLIETLDHLSDSLHMSKQTTDSAMRKLRSTKDIVAQIRKDTAASETGIRWIENGKWERRLAERECARVCRDVVGGFEQVCQGYRERLVDKAGIVVA